MRRSVRALARLGAALALCLLTAVAAQAQDVAAQARAAASGGEPEAAWALLVEAARDDPTGALALRETAQEILAALHTEIGLTQGFAGPEAALAKLKVAWPAMLDEQAAGALFISEAEYKRARLNLYRLLNDVTLQVAQARLQVARTTGAESAWQEALRYAQFCIDYQPQERNPPARLLKAQIQEGMGDLNGALATLQDLLGRLPSGDVMWLDVRDRVQSLRGRIEQAGGDPSVVHFAAPPPTPAQGVAAPTFTTAPPAEATPPPPPPPTSKNPVVAKLQQALNHVKRLDYKGLINEFTGAVSLPDLVPWIIGVPAFILGYWVIWVAAIRRMAQRGNLRASLWLRRVKWLGLAGFIAFLVSGINLKPKEKRQRCPFCSKPIDDIASYSSLNFFVCPHCNENIKPVYDLKDYTYHLADHVQRMVGHRQTMGHGDSPLEKDAMANLVRTILTYAVRQRATDLHIENELDGLKVRARIDGMLAELLHFNKAVAPLLTNAMKITANLDITHRAVPQDGKFNIWIDNSDVDVRVNSAPGSHGDNVTMRLLDRRRILLDSSKLGLYGDSLEHFERAIRKPHGLILVTGPSGSGKSTTLYVALSTINTGDRSIITIEDPIEYEVKGLKQMQVNPAQDFTFATGLRSILRQDPDVIMVGEVRDKATAEIALDAAMTGHLVFTTLHTIDSATAISRLNDLGVEPRRYASALELVIAQRLIRLICPECKKAYKPQGKDLEALKIAPGKEQPYFHGVGCENCNGSGFYGRTGVFEVLHPTESVKEILETNTTASVIRELSRKDGMRTLREEGVLKALHGQTTIEEVIRVTT